jgi:hypothetical protein
MRGDRDTIRKAISTITPFSLMKQIPIDKLNQDAIACLTTGEPLVIEHEGKILGIFLPKQPVVTAHLDQALEKLDQTLDKILTETGMIESEFAAYFDLSRPCPLPKLRSNT